MRTTTILAVLTIALAATAAACSGGGSNKATPTASDFSRTSAYFGALNQAAAPALNLANNPGDVTPAPGATAAAVPNDAPIVNNVPALRALETALESVEPPPAVQAAHQALLDATRDLVERQSPSTATTTTTTATPPNAATAAAQTGTAEKRFRDACYGLSTVAQDADSPVELPCPDADPTETVPPVDETPAPDASPAP